ncbi:MAG: hypothetical protein Q9195_006265 [Heterodermia aff. obscurata]
MADDKNAGGDIGKSRDKFIQTKLTSAFISYRTSPPLTISPYFTTPIHESNQGPESKIDAHPERRALPKSEEPPSLHQTRSSGLLALVAAETKSLLSGILLTTPHAPADGRLYVKGALPPLESTACPELNLTPVRVLNADSIDAALAVSTWHREKDGAPRNEKPVLILNMANAYHSGGGWLRGALAQEEALCYRSSLSLTLKNRFYPIPSDGGLYSPTVVIIRHSMASGHRLLDLNKPEQLPVVSVVSVAAVRGPAMARDRDGNERYKNIEDRTLMKQKMRTVLRIAAKNGHRRLVLGALGCGAFANPREEVVKCWNETLREHEFQGGWWHEIVFAVLDGDTRKSSGNFGPFLKGLGGLEV